MRLLQLASWRTRPFPTRFTAVQVGKGKCYALFLLALAVLAVGCAGFPLVNRPAADTALSASPYALAMAPDQRQLLDQIDPLPEYRLNVQVDPTTLMLEGQMTLTLPAEALGSAFDEPPAEYFFRLYPNLSHYGGHMQVTLATINGQGAPFTYAASDTAVRVAVPPSVSTQGEPVTIGLQWTLEAADWPPEHYSLFGQSESVVSLPLFYPLLAVPNQQGTGTWNLGMGLVHGDAAFSEAALYQADVTVPEGYAVVATGSLLSIEDADEGDADVDSVEATMQEDAEDSQAPAPLSWKTWSFVTGPVREMALFVSNQFHQVQTTASDVTVNSWYLAGDEVTGRAAAEYAAAALRVYSNLFGAYPYAELDVVAGPLTFRGMEYPGLFELGIGLYRDHADELEFRIAHEAAHQWWYNIVGNDPVSVPWLDEGLAEYSTYFYYQQTQGQAAADNLAARRWQYAYEYTRDIGEDAIVNQPLDAFEANYEPMVYGKAALFHHALRETVGEEAYVNLLRQYVERYRFGVATPEHFLALAEELADGSVRDVYQRWIMEREAPEPEETPVAED